MTHDKEEQGFRPEDGDEQEPKTIWGHSLAAAGVCVAIGVAIALIVILG